ncbi:MAG: hypothetical protein KDK97_24125, partial [Verrucomicrobiales bacterium]|nr:hypothetical protein [Verrucomicrobiales bacterium]
MVTTSKTINLAAVVVFTNFCKILFWNTEPFKHHETCASITLDALATDMPADGDWDGFERNWS